MAEQDHTFRVVDEASEPFYGSAIAQYQSGKQTRVGLQVERTAGNGNFTVQLQVRLSPTMPWDSLLETSQGGNGTAKFSANFSTAAEYRMVATVLAANTEVRAVVV